MGVAVGEMVTRGAFDGVLVKTFAGCFVGALMGCFVGTLVG